MGRPESATKKKEKAKAPISAGWIGTVLFLPTRNV